MNFFCSTRVSDIKIRQDFLKKYSIIRINIFEEQVFDDTSYTICSFQFSKNSNGSKNSNNTICTIYPENKKIDFNLTPENNYTIGGEIYKLPQNNKWTVSRAVNGKSNTNILIKCIDDSVKIRLSIVDDDTTIKYIDNTVNHTARSFAILMIEPKIDLKHQEQLVEEFNVFLNNYRDQYNSLFLANYREYTRKRISFGLVYSICNYLLNTNNNIGNH